MALRAVWSFWTKPYRAGRDASWADDWYHWLAPGACRSTPRASIIPRPCWSPTKPSYRVLVDALELPFTEVSTALNDLQADPDWWALGKLEAYRRQADPFVHIDADVFLWTPLNPALSAAPVFAQNPEPIPSLSTSYYRPDLLEAVIAPERLPVEWTWYRRALGRLARRVGYGGVFGGARVDFIQHYAAEALKIATDARNRPGLARLGDKIGHMILLEQYLLLGLPRNITPSSRAPPSPTSTSATSSRGSSKPTIRVRRKPPATPTWPPGRSAIAASAAIWNAGVRQDLPRFYERCRERAHGFRQAIA